MINFILIVVGVQVFNLNTAEAVVSVDGSVTVNNTISYMAKRCWEKSMDTRSQQIPQTPHHGHNKTWKKFFPERLSITNPHYFNTTVCYEPVMEHHTEVNSYQYLYFKSINPPPPKA